MSLCVPANVVSWSWLSARNAMGGSSEGREGNLAQRSQGTQWVVRLKDAKADLVLLARTTNQTPVSNTKLNSAFLCATLSVRRSFSEGAVVKARPPKL
jgi:hypothetical protein